MEKKRVLVGMSGGVDSSLAAAFLIEQGYEVTGGFIKNWSDSHDLQTGECTWRQDRRDAMRVAAKLNIPLLDFDFEKEYRDRVIQRLFDESQRGLTPNPDVLCNEEIKFGLFFEAAMKLGFDFVATGHYARVQRIENAECRIKDGSNLNSQFSILNSKLLRGVDPEKDQSYFLHRVSQDALRHTLFPIGHLTKKEVRLLATRYSLPTATKPDSQGICFIGKLDYHEFLRKKIPATPGDIVTPEGEVVGHHDGLDAYTIGQRQGLSVSQDRRAWYVAGKDRATNRLIIVPDREHPLLYAKEAIVRDMHWISDDSRFTIHDSRVDVMIRYRQKPEAATVRPLLTKEGDELTARVRREVLRVFFSNPVWALAPGQSAVFYRGDECLGGGFIADHGLESGHGHQATAP